MGDLFGAMPGRPATRPVAACLEIRDRENDHEVRRVDLHESPMDIGRSPKVKVRLDSPTLSRRHAELSRDPHGHWWLNDLRSRNGTRVNERKVTECQLQNGDEIRIGKFSLRFVDRAANAPEVAADDDAGNSSLRVEDTSDTSIRSWDQAEPVGIDTTHLATLTEFGNRLTRTPDVIERLQALCRLMVRKDFRAISAVVIRISNRNPKAEPRILVDSPTQFEGAGSPHISRGLLTSVLRSRTPAMATNAPRRDLGAIEVSISPDQESLTAVACPLRLGENETDLLYATLPPECTGTDWLALAALVAQQYIQAEQVLAAQRQAQQRAAIEMEMAQAQKIQAHLLAAPPQIDGLDVAIGFEPCRWVGGDYVDVLRT
ncbi:MAG: FHA domain-containing protein, partial [Phycisphaerae bacterium]|nr:FHA domain-containing protein [Phycisphaerae bacterium]